MIDSTESTGFTEDFFAAFPGMPRISLLEPLSEKPLQMEVSDMARPLQVILQIIRKQHFPTKAIWLVVYIYIPP